MPPLRRSLRLITADGFAFSLMVGAGESYLPAFALALGLGGVEVGLIATVPMIAGGVIQLIAPAGISRFGYRRWVSLCAGLQASTFLLLVSMSLVALPTALLYLAAGLYWAAGMATGPGWNAWVGALIPTRIRGRYFGIRSSLMQVAMILGVAGAGVWLHLGGGAPVTFAALFGVAFLARATSTALLANHPDVPARAQPIKKVLGAAWASPKRTWMIAVVATGGAVNVAGPFFTPYLLAERALSYVEYMILIGAVFAAKIVALPLLGRRAAASASLVSAVAGAGIAALPLLWTVSGSFAYLLLIQIASGVVWAAFELAAQLGFLGAAGESERAGLLSLYNLLNSLSVALGSIVGAIVLATLGGGRDAYVALFAISSALRVAAAGLLAVVARGEAIGRFSPVRVLSIRPWGGALLRPIAALLPAARPTRPSNGPTRRRNLRRW